MQDNNHKDDMQHKIATKNLNDAINSDLALRMVKRLQQSLAPNPKK